jgi:hypothetical protein
MIIKQGAKADEATKPFALIAKNNQAASGG